MQNIVETFTRPSCACDPTFLWELSGLASHSNLEKCHIGANHCSVIHSLSIISFLVLLSLAAFQLIRFYFSIADKIKTNLRLLYSIVITICARMYKTGFQEIPDIYFYSLVRSARFALLQWTTPSNELLNFLYYAPLVLIFTGVSVLLFTWQQMLSVVTGKGTNSTVQLFHATIIGNVFVACSSMILLQMDSRLCPLPIFIACPIFYFLYKREGLTKWRNSIFDAAGPRAACFPKATTLTMVSVAGVFLFTSVFVIFGVLNFTSFSEHSHAIRHITLLLELIFVLFLLYVMAQLAQVSILPMPEKFDCEWLTAMFREKGAMRYSNTINSISGEQKLTGGCHSAVRKMELAFSEKSDWLPRAIVVKVLKWEKSFYGRMCLAARASLPRNFETKEVSYLKSYDIEAKFYRNIGPEVHGIKIPRVYYNHNDKFNNQFGMVMEDITFRDGSEALPITGQPFGFTFGETRSILSQLAYFHAWFWEHPDLQSYDVWDVAGYYTASKRLQFKNEVEAHWCNILQNLGCELSLMGKENFGSRLYRNRDALNSIYENNKLKTIVHGDYKISNIFVDQRMLAKLSEQSKYSADSGSVYVIDWQWVGLGIGAVDVAYYLATSTVLDTVHRSSMKKLVKLYHSILVEKGVKNYTFKEMWMDFRLAFVDFIVYVISCKWTTMVPSDFLANQAQLKDGLHIRSLAHAKQLISIADEFMDSLGFTK